MRFALIGPLLLLVAILGLASALWGLGGQQRDGQAQVQALEQAIAELRTRVDEDFAPLDSLAALEARVGVLEARPIVRPPTPKPVVTVRPAPRPVPVFSRGFVGP